ncbi:MAG: DUF4340 domain-containing protein [Chloroflexota bacterium]
MRMNRGTISLLAILLVVIVVVLVVNNQQLSAPGATATPSTVTGPLLPGVAAENIVRYEVRDNTTGNFISLTQDSGGAWNIDATNATAGRSPEQSLINTTAGQIVAINYTNTFEGDDLATYGLDHPTYTVFVTTSDGQFYTVYIGAKSPTSSRYYAVVEQSNVPAATDTPSAGDQAIATLDVADENANEEGVLPPALDETQEATAEATSTVASKRAALAQATEEPGGAIATLETEGQNANESGVVPEGTDEATSEATVDLTAQATAESTPEATAEPVANPQVTLEGTQTIYLIPQTVIDTLKRWLTTPPYAAEPTAEAVGVQGTIQPTPVLEEGGDPNLIPEGTAIATQSATQEATAEATAGS